MQIEIKTLDDFRRLTAVLPGSVPIRFDSVGNPYDTQEINIVAARGDIEDRCDGELAVYIKLVAEGEEE